MAVTMQMHERPARHRSSHPCAEQSPGSESPSMPDTAGSTPPPATIDHSITKNLEPNVPRERYQGCFVHHFGAREWGLAPKRSAGACPLGALPTLPRTPRKRGQARSEDSASQSPIPRLTGYGNSPGSDPRSRGSKDRTHRNKERGKMRLVRRVPGVRKGIQDEVIGSGLQKGPRNLITRWRQRLYGDVNPLPKFLQVKHLGTPLPAAHSRPCRERQPLA